MSERLQLDGSEKRSRVSEVIAKLTRSMRPVEPEGAARYEKVADHIPSSGHPEDDGYWPLYDEGGGMSEYDGPGDAGMIGVLAKIEMNEEDHPEDLAFGLPEGGLSLRSSD